MALTARQIDTAKPTDKDDKLSDAQGLYLLVKKNASGREYAKPGNWPGRISSITLKCSTTGPGVTVISAASVQNFVPAKLKNIARYIHGGYESTIDYNFMKLLLIFMAEHNAVKYYRMPGQHLSCGIGGGCYFLSAITA